MYGLFAIALLIAICTDAARYLRGTERNKFIAAAIGVVAIFVATYAINYSHLAFRWMPHYPVTELSERLSRAANLLNSNFTWPFRILLVAGLALSPFLPRVRWLALPLGAGLWLWANAASYDLRNALGLLLITAFIPLFAVARRLATARGATGERPWQVRDLAIAAGVAVLCIVLTLPLALSDEKLKQRFAHEQMIRGVGIEINQNVEKLLVRGCTVFSVDGYITTIAGFQKFLPQIRFFHVADPLSDQLAQQISESAGCTGILYPPHLTHRSILDFIAAQTMARGYRKAAEGMGMELLVSDVRFRLVLGGGFLPSPENEIPDKEEVEQEHQGIGDDLGKQRHVDELQQLDLQGAGYQTGNHHERDILDEDPDVDLSPEDETLQQGELHPQRDRPCRHVRQQYLLGRSEDDPEREQVGRGGGHAGHRVTQQHEIDLQGIVKRPEMRIPGCRRYRSSGSGISRNPMRSLVRTINCSVSNS